MSVRRAIVAGSLLAVLACGSNRAGSSSDTASGSSTGLGGSGGGTLAATSSGGGGGGYACDEGDTRLCYGGAPELAGVGICEYGEQSCVQDGEFTTWGECEGWVGPQREQCDDIDSDCDGDLNDADCPLACDGVSPLWNDPFFDGSLRLKTTQTAGMAAPLNQHSWICAQDMARINICDNTTIELAGGMPTVIGGNGMGGIGNQQVHVVLKSQQTEDIWVLLDVTQAPITFELATPNAFVTVTSKGNNTVYFGGSAKGVKVVTEGALTVSIALTVSGGGSDLTSGGGPLTPPSGCP